MTNSYGAKSPLRFVGALLLAGCTALRAQETWSPVVSPTSQNLWAACYGAGQFAAVGEGGTILTSGDGMAWTKRPSGLSLWLVSVGFGNDLFVTVGDQGTILTSRDGALWTGRTSGTTARINGIAYGGGRWIAVAESGELLTSTDGSAWSKLSPSSDRLRGITYAYGEFVITGDNGLMRVTIDATDYDSRLLPERLFVEAVTYARRSFLAVGEAGYAITSTDAINWQPVATGTSAHLRGVTFFNGRFIVVGENGAVLTSTDVTSPWIPRASGTNALFTGAAASDAAAVVVGFAGTIIRSAPAAAAPAIAAAPASCIAMPGDNILFNVAATGSMPLAYQWNFNGQPLAGQASDQLLVSNALPAQAGAYTVTVTNARGTSTSPPAGLTLVTSTAPSPIVDPTFTPTLTLAGNVAAAVEQADGKVIIGGSQFFVTPGVSPFALARLNLDGSLDSTFNLGSGLNNGGTISRLVLQPDARLLVGGNFNTFNGTARTNLLRLAVDGSLDSTFTAAGVVTSTPPTQVSVQPDGKVLVISNRVLYRLNGDGTLDPTFAGPTNGVASTVHALQPNGKILVNDHNPGISYFPIRPLRRLNADGTVDAAFSPISAPDVDLDDGRFDAVFALSDGTALAQTHLVHRGYIGEGVYRLAADGTRDASWPGIFKSAFAFTLGSIFAISPAGKIHQAFGSSVLTPSVALRRFNADASPDFSFDPRGGPNGNVTGIVPLRDGRTIVLGDFTSFDGLARPKLVRLVAANALALQAPVIVSVSPEAAAVRPGESVTVRILAAGAGPLIYASNVGTLSAITGGIAVSIPTHLSGSYNVTVTITNRMGSVTTAPVRVIVAPSAPIITTQPAALATIIGRTAVFTVGAAGSGPFAYQWFRGSTLVGTSSSLTLVNLATTDSGDYTVLVRNSLGVTTSQVAHLRVDGTPALANISTRASAGSDERTLIAGFVIQGATAKNILVRGVGPGLAPFGVTGLLPNPVLTVYDGANRVIAANDNWDSAVTPNALFSSLGAFVLAGGSADAALQVALAPGNYTVVLADSAGRTGTALVEIYEADSNTNRMINISTRAFIGTDANIGIAGLVVRGQQPGRYLIRGAGPALTPFGVNGALANPILTLTTSLGAVVAVNDAWGSGANAVEIAATATRVGAFPFALSSHDAALLVTLQPGNYTALVSGANGTTGVALIEVYEIP